MRGLAAVAVVCHHALAIMGPFTVRSGYLAVDFFFVLSGFVIAGAYDGKIAEGLTVGGFFRARAIRLYPLYLFGALVSIFDAGVGQVFHAGFQWPSWLAYVEASGLALIGFPTPGWISHHGTLYPLNSSFWSLLFEFVVNMVFVVAWPWLRGRTLYAVIAVCGAALAIGCFVRGSADLGASYEHFPWSMARVGFSFFLGVLLRRKRFSLRAPVWTPYLIGLAILLVPVSTSARPWFDSATVLFVLPALVVLGSNLEPVGVKAEKRADLWGVTSYGVYALHTPLVHGLDMMLHRLPAALRPEHVAPLYVVVLVPLLLIVAWAVYEQYDKPVRTMLRRRFDRSPPRQRDAIAAE